MVKDVIKVSTVAFNAKWGDKEKNLNRMKGYIEAAASEGANLIVFPEMALTGYDDEEDKAKPDKMQSKLAEVVPGHLRYLVYLKCYIRLSLVYYGGYYVGSRFTEW